MALPSATVNPHVAVKYCAPHWSPLPSLSSPRGESQSPARTRARGEPGNYGFTHPQRLRSAPRRGSQYGSSLQRPTGKEEGCVNSTWDLPCSAVNVDPPTCSEAKAYELAAEHFSRRQNNTDQSAAESALRDLLYVSQYDADEIVKMVITYADILFFQNRLAACVQWRWSSACQPSIIGMTSVRRAAPGAYLTQITLSRKAILGKAYNQRLVIATILHEAIHCYLFILRGYHAREEGGHTSAFRKIARLIDGWVGDPDFLQLHRTEAVLENFLVQQPRKKAGIRCRATGTPRWQKRHRANCL